MESGAISGLSGKCPDCQSGHFPRESGVQPMGYCTGGWPSPGPATRRSGCREQKTGNVPGRKTVLTAGFRIPLENFLGREQSGKEARYPLLYSARKKKIFTDSVYLFQPDQQSQNMKTGTRKKIQKPVTPAQRLTTAPEHTRLLIAQEQSHRPGHLRS